METALSDVYAIYKGLVDHGFTDQGENIEAMYFNSPLYNQ